MPFWLRMLTFPVFVIEMGGHIYPLQSMRLFTSLHRNGSLGIDVIFSDFGCDDLAWTCVLYNWAAGAAKRCARNEFTGGAWEHWRHGGIRPVLCLPLTLLPSDQHFLYFEAAGVIITLILFGRFMETRAKGQAGAAIERLIGLQPQTAWIRMGDGFFRSPY